MLLLSFWLTVVVVVWALELDSFVVSFAAVDDETVASVDSEADSSVSAERSELRYE